MPVHAMIASGRINLRVPFAQKEQAKALGARWDAGSRTWYVPSGADLSLFAPWLPAEAVRSEQDEDAPPERGTSLLSFLQQLGAVLAEAGKTPQWVRVELRELRTSKGTYYLTVEQRDDRGDAVAAADVRIWASAAGRILGKFRDVTGSDLGAGIKLLVLLRPRLHPLYGFTLEAEDIDPSFTLGDLEAKLRRIREALRLERIAELNKQLTSPTEFCRIAVLSPETSAGLGDFQTEARLLSDAGLCSFHFFYGTFQGPDTSTSLCAALERIADAHANAPFDALAIIRGGGAVTDLAWLNDLAIARSVCMLRVPVFTGIGHARDSTVLDEIAHRRFDTPSKVSNYIVQTIAEGARAASNHARQIVAQARRASARNAESLDAARLRVLEQAERVLQRGEAKSAGLAADVRRLAGESVARGKATLEREWSDFSSQAALTVKGADGELEAMRAALLQAARHQALPAAALHLQHLLQEIRHASKRTRLQALGELQHTLARVGVMARQRLRLEESGLNGLGKEIVLGAGEHIAPLASDLEHFRERIAGDSQRALRAFVALISQARDSIETGTRRAHASCQASIAELIRTILALGPKGTLERGYAVVRAEDGQVLTGTAQALRHALLRVQFHDGTIRVKNEDHQEENP